MKDKIFLLILIILFGCSITSSKNADLTLSEKEYVIKYLKNTFDLPTLKEQHIYLLQSIRCASCAEHSFDFIIDNENKETQKIFIITSTLKQEYYDKIIKMPNTIILKDSSQTYAKYGILYSKDLFINVKNGLIQDFIFVTPHKLSEIRIHIKK